MDVSRNSEVAASCGGLAEQAQQATRGLYHRASGVGGVTGIDGADEIFQVLGSLKLLSQNVARSLPELGTWLERQLWLGNLDVPGDQGGFETLVTSVFDATAALARAQEITVQLCQELATAQAAAKELSY
ncbi:hypothetical protein [Amycolatopsis thermophila]|uniref:3-methyladenine DNA glycosylase/8-oxoguanine DNA glycosylase n=1 Tax=Amycolatopsis thermophila TaxID=206084 RepID=A0ABU0EX33_9PSEU|nr:hypothetical protein [Amycolatopsis thermophila]MDQ0379435.1 3-methyladenine DNA glycosylase/8-oxoguanine DNA glycosylase [Amycolatopsis thermophila]